MSQVLPRRFWERASRRLAYRVNLALWLERFAPIVFTVCSLSAVVCYSARRLRVPSNLFSVGTVTVLLGVGLIVAVRIRRQFFAQEDARLLLEWTLKMDSRLTAAATGLVAWPAPVDPLPRVLSWRGSTLFGWLGSAAALMVMSFILPVPAVVDRTPNPVAPPPSLAETEAVLQDLLKSEIADPKAVDELAAEAHELASRPPEQLYTHSGLEAADALHDETLAALDSLAHEFESAASAFSPPEGASSSNSEGNLKTSSDSLSAALRGLKEGKLPANPALLGALAKAQASAARNLTPQQAAQLAERLKEAGGKARGIAGARKGKAFVARGDPNSKAYLSRVGPSGTGGGETSAPLAFSNQAAPANDGKLAALSSDDLSRSSLGDALGTTSDKHDVDPTKVVAPMSAGAVNASARGGEAVWVDHLAPSERAALKDFFK